MSNGVIIALVVIFAIPAYFLGGVMIKILWGWWAVPLFPALAGWKVYQDGMESFIYIPASLVAAILVTWLWQRTTLFLKGDQFIGRLTMMN